MPRKSMKTAKLETTKINTLPLLPDARKERPAPAKSSPRMSVPAPRPAPAASAAPVSAPAPATTPARTPAPAAAAGHMVEFQLQAPQAATVCIAGSFNGWEPSQSPMRKGRNGVWKARVALPAGRHEYLFVADGQWICDPKAPESTPNPFGNQNSVIIVA
jgi:hypothetical protein